jgi:hypothetical protein
MALDVFDDLGALRETERLTNEATISEFNADGRKSSGVVAVQKVEVIRDCDRHISFSFS